MTDPRTVRQLFDDLRRLPPDERTAALNEHAAHDPDLRREVESLLDNDREWTALDASPFAEIAGALPDIDAVGNAFADAEFPGYRIIRVVGAGGMGVVFEAEQEEPRRRVAIKVLRPGLISRASLRRFRHESEVLARLRHPGVAQIFEAGAAVNNGAASPFFAMEFVNGQCLTQHADDARLDRIQRVKLVIDVCDAVEHAHQRGVIHRDLKPSNILIDEHGRPKVLDFGVARSIDADARVTSMGEAGSHLIGTLAYMAPEQLSDDPADIDTRADVYAIGAVAWELLAGKPAHDIAGRSLPNAIIAVRDGNVTPLGEVRHECRGDLDVVIMKALEKDPTRRYPTASALAADLRRVLADEPIDARPPTAAYHLRKFAARNRPLALALAAILVILGAGVVATSIGMTRALRAEDAAKRSARDAAREAAIAQAVNDFLEYDLLSAVDPGRTGDRDITMREVLDIAARELDGKFPDQPLVEASIRTTVANVYWRLGDNAAAEMHQRRAVELLATHRGTEHISTINAINTLSTTLMDQGRINDAIKLISANLNAMRRNPEGEEAALRAMSNLSAAYLRLGRIAEAEPIMVEVLNSKRRVLGERHESTLTSINNLAGLYIGLARFEDAEALYREAFEGRRDVLGEADPKTLGTMSSLSWALSGLGRHDEAEETLRNAIAIMRERLDHDHPYLLRALNALANTLAEAGRFEEAENAIRECLDGRVRTLGLKHIETVSTMSNLARILVELRRFREVIEVTDQILEIETGVVPRGHWIRAETRVDRGVSLHALGRTDEADAAVVEGCCILLKTLGPEHERSTRAANELIRIRENDPALIEARSDGTLADLICND